MASAQLERCMVLRLTFRACSLSRAGGNIRLHVTYACGVLAGPAGATIKKMAADTGAQINMDSVVQPGAPAEPIQERPDGLACDERM